MFSYARSANPPCRLLYSLPKTSADDVRDLMVLERGKTEYDARAPWRDFGVHMGRIDNVAPGIARFQVIWHPELDSVLENDLEGGGFAFAILWKTEDVIHGLVVEQAKLLRVDRPEHVTETCTYGIEIAAESAVKRI